MGNANTFDNYEIDDMYIVYGNIGKVIGYSLCSNMVNDSVGAGCIGCRGRSHFQYQNGEIDKSCAHNGHTSVVKVHQRAPSANMRW